MEWTFRITEAQYLRAWNLHRGVDCAIRKRLLLSLLGVWLVMMAVIVAALVLSPGHEKVGSAARHSSNGSAAIGAIGGILAAVVAAANVYQVRRRYRADATMEGEFTVRLDGQSFTVSNSATAALPSGWRQFTGWREDIKRGLIVLRQQPQQFVVLNVGGFQEPQRVELRTILAQALPPN
jgi:hypothetical protein